MPVKIDLAALKAVTGKLGGIKDIFGGIIGRFSKKKKKSDEDIDEDSFIPSSSRGKPGEDDDGEPSSGGDDGPDDDDVELDDEFEEYDEEEERQKKKRLMVFGGSAAAASLVLGVVTWALVSGGSEDAGAPDERVPRVVENLERLEAETQALDQALGREPLAAPGEGGGETRSLNEMAASAIQPGTGVLIMASMDGDFTALAPAPQGVALGPAPNLAMVDETDLGLIPRISPNGVTPFSEYSRKSPPPAGDKPRVAIIISSLGNSRAATEAAIRNFPPEVALAIDSYARGAGYWAEQARAGGHEVVLTLPLEAETFPFDDAGPGMLRTLDALEKNVEQMHWIMSRASGFFGLMTVQGSKFLASSEQTENMVAELKKRGLMYVDGGHYPASLGPRIALKQEAIWAAVEIHLDADPSRKEISAKFAELENLAQRRSLAVAAISPTPGSLEMLSNWLKTLPEKGISLVALSSLANKQLIR